MNNPSPRRPEGRESDALRKLRDLKGGSRRGISATELSQRRPDTDDQQVAPQLRQQSLDLTGSPSALRKYIKLGAGYALRGFLTGQGTATDGLAPTQGSGPLDLAKAGADSLHVYAGRLETTAVSCAAWLDETETKLDQVEGTINTEGRKDIAPLLQLIRDAEQHLNAAFTAMNAVETVPAEARKALEAVKNAKRDLLAAARPDQVGADSALVLMGQAIDLSDSILNPAIKNADQVVVDNMKITILRKQATDLRARITEMVNKIVPSREDGQNALTEAQHIVGNLTTAVNTATGWPERVETAEGVLQELLDGLNEAITLRDATAMASQALRELVQKAEAQMNIVNEGVSTLGAMKKDTVTPSEENINKAKDKAAKAADASMSAKVQEQVEKAKEFITQINGIATEVNISAQSANTTYNVLLTAAKTSAPQTACQLVSENLTQLDRYVSDSLRIASHTIDTTLVQLNTSLQQTREQLVTFTKKYDDGHTASSSGDLSAAYLAVSELNELANAVTATWGHVQEGMQHLNTVLDSVVRIVYEAELKKETIKVLSTDPNQIEVAVRVVEALKRTIEKLNTLVKKPREVVEDMRDIVDQALLYPGRIGKLVEKAMMNQAIMALRDSLTPKAPEGYAYDFNYAKRTMEESHQKRHTEEWEKWTAVVTDFQLVNAISLLPQDLQLQIALYSGQGHPGLSMEKPERTALEEEIFRWLQTNPGTMDNTVEILDPISAHLRLFDKK